jgi:hypothetical protein
VDVVNGLDGEGPYTPERSGALPLVEFAQWILEQELTIGNTFLLNSNLLFDHLQLFVLGYAVNLFHLGMI